MKTNLLTKLLNQQLGQDYEQNTKRTFNRRTKREWLIENLIPENEIVILYAPTKLSKIVEDSTRSSNWFTGTTKTGNVTISQTQHKAI